MSIIQRSEIRMVVEKAVREVKITDIHTHLYAPPFKELLLSGIDELLTYHYLISEVMRFSDISTQEFWQLSKSAQADLIWKTLFIEHTPISEATRGVLTCLKRLGLDVASRNLESYRQYFNGLSQEQRIDRVFEVAGISEVVMTNDPFDPLENPVWDSSASSDSRFKAALRLDVLLMQWETKWAVLREWGYNVTPELTGMTIYEIRRFLKDWMTKIQALYAAVSLPPDFRFPDDSICSKLIQECVLPVCEELNKPFALMIGVKRSVNPELRLAGDGMGRSQIESVEALCSHYPNNKFMVTMLSLENQHELCITARKFRNLLIFGCWWFLNTPRSIEEMTRMRFELLGMSFIPQHSDARVLEQLVYKWEHSRIVISEVLSQQYDQLLQAGWPLTKADVERDIKALFGGTFWEFLDR